jgi:hypothetical protein
MRYGIHTFAPRSSPLRPAGRRGRVRWGRFELAQGPTENPLDIRALPAQPPCDRRSRSQGQRHLPPHPTSPPPGAERGRSWHIPDDGRIPVRMREYPSVEGEGSRPRSSSCMFACHIRIAVILSDLVCLNRRRRACRFQEIKTMPNLGAESGGVTDAPVNRLYLQARASPDTCGLRADLRSAPGRACSSAARHRRRTPSRSAVGSAGTPAA